MKTKKKPATSSSADRFDVYDFDDHGVESYSAKIADKYRSIIVKDNNNKPKKPRKYSPVTKYNFLQCFAQGADSKPKELYNDVQEVEVDDDTSKEGLSCSSRIASSGSSNCVAASRTEREVVTINIDDDEIESSPSIDFSNLAAKGALEELALEHCFSGFAIDDDVVIKPDYVKYGERCPAECQITFTSSCIKLDCSVVRGDEGSLYVEWLVDDILKIESQWCHELQTAIVHLLFKMGGKGLAEDATMSRGISELRFAVNDPCWHKQQEAIKLLNTGYDAKWILVSDIDARKSDCLEENYISSSKHYFPNPDEPVKEVIYPRGDPDAVPISTREIKLLEPERFVNDIIIDFYMKYLENKINPEEKHRFHFFNCFFFRKLADLDRDQRGAGDGRAAFRRVRKWTRKVNLFEKDYIFIPVNFSLHWSLIVICHPGDAVKFEDRDMQKLPKVPCILHMDSIKGSHRGLKKLFQSYLWEEWKERGNQPEDVNFNFLNLQFVPLELPQQENFYDCGMFLLHYTELFLKDAPVCFNPFKRKEPSNFLSKDWFPPVEASSKRAYIKELIIQALVDYQETASPASCDEDKHSPEVVIVEEKDIGVELPEGACRSVKTESYDSRVISDQGSLAEPSVETPKNHDSSKRSFDDSYHTFGKMILHDQTKNIMTPIEEVKENSGQQANLEGSSSTDVEINGNHLFNDIFCYNSPETKNMLTPSPSTGSVELENSVVEDSEEEDGIIDITERSLFGLRKIEDKSVVEGDCVIVQPEEAILELNKRPGSKRRSPSPREGVRRRLRSSSKDVNEVFVCD